MTETAPTPAPTPAPDDSAKLKDEIASLKAEIAKLKPEAKPKQDDQDLGDKAREQKKQDETRLAEIKRIESSALFNVNISKFVQDNKSLLPNEINEIIAAAEKEKYASGIHKANAIKASMIKSYFSVAGNHELLTSGQKLQLDDWLKLTNTGREETAETIYENIFEPAIETMRKIKKAEELVRARDGSTPGSNPNGLPDYVLKQMERSKKRYIGDKHGA